MDNSWQQVPYPQHHPRFSSDGILTVEGGTTNFLTYPRTLSHQSWVKGSSMTIYPDLLAGPDLTYQADRISVSALTGNINAQNLSKIVSLNPQTDFVASFCMALADGQFGATDYIEVAGVVRGPQRVYLAEIYNQKLGNFIPVSIPFRTVGTMPAIQQYDTKSMQAVTITLHVERAVSIDWAYGQIEPGVVWTSFVDQEKSINSRDADFIQYPSSPIAGLSSFVFYYNLASWRGDGVLFNAGNFQVEIYGGRIEVICGTAKCSSPSGLPPAAQIAVRVSKGLGKIRLYINRVLVSEAPLGSYVASKSPITIPGEGVRQIKASYLFSQDLNDGAQTLNSSIGSDLYLLHDQDVLLPDLPQGYGVVSFAPVYIPPRSSAMVRFQPIPGARQPINAIITSQTSATQVTRVTVQIAGSIAQSDSVVIDGYTYTATSGSSPTVVGQALALANLINATPKARPVTATVNTGGTFTVTADVAGEPFDLTPGERLTATTTSANQTNTSQLQVANAVDFVPGRAQVYRDHAYICEVSIMAINLSTNQLTVVANRTSDLSRMLALDILIQPNWQLALGTNSYFVYSLENDPQVEVSYKSINAFGFRNVGDEPKVVTPYVKVAV